jgi:hypothetical protein
MKEAKMRALGVLLLAGSAFLPPPAPVSAQQPQTSPPSGQPAQAPPGQGLPLQRVGSMSELMVDIIYPASDAVFYVTTREPKDEVGWNELRGKALMLAESANLLMMPGHARDQDRWITDSKLLLDVGAAAFRAAKRKDVDALSALNDQLYQSCVTCHQDYRPNYGRRR